MKVLVTGGAGYIGGTICSALEDQGHTPVVLDSLVTGARAFTANRSFYEADIADADSVARLFRDHPDIACTIHCAALIVVPESTRDPHLYYQENVAKSLSLFKSLVDNGCRRIVFSSSASVYGTVPGFMVTEDAPIAPGSPYARTKVVMEMILEDFCRAYDLRGVALRYFNPIGADPRLRSGNPVKDPSQVIWRLVRTALGQLPEFQITGTDYDTRDGTGVRDYIHVWDLARAHVLAVERFDQLFAPGAENRYRAINLGTGTGVTVRELVAAFEEVFGRPISKCDAARRPGDVAGAYANADRAAKLLGWRAELSIQEGIRDALRWGAVRDGVLGLGGIA
ncbi:MAG: UDP-glucose 4-epimerase GalE [Candidatus Schekmanbacteria bacterium]|nr:UDP-glucose 4-epimerase GalE [Candidatus Schekmanbacteria bacterium]